MPGEILQRIAERSQPATPTGAWSFLPSATSIRNLPFSGTAILEDFRKEFSTEQLEAERVLVRSPDNQLELNPVLGGASTYGLFLRTDKDQAPFDIVNQSGSLATTDPPAFDCDRDGHTKRLSGDTQAVLVASNDDDLVVLRLLGLPCTPAAVLASMTGEQLRRLFADAPEFSGSAAKR